MRYFIATSILVSTLCSNLASGQNKVMDSLNLALKNAHTDKERIDVMIQLANACDIKDNLKYGPELIAFVEKKLAQAKNPEDIKKLIEARFKGVGVVIYYYSSLKKHDTLAITRAYRDHINLSLKYKDTQGIIQGSLALADAYGGWGFPLKKLDQLKKGLALMEKLNSKKGQSRFIIQLGFFYSDNGDTSQAIQYLHRAQNLEKKIGDSTRISRGYYIIGKFFSGIRKFDQALENYKKAQSRYEAVKDTSELLQVYYEMGNTYKDLNNSDSALQYYQRALTMAKANHNNLQYMGASAVGIGDVYCMQQRYREAIACHLEVYNIFKNIDRDFSVAVLFVASHLAKDYYLAKNYSSALPFAQEALELAYRAQQVSDIKESENMVYKIDSAAGHYKEALAHYQQYLFYNNMLNAEAIHKASAQEKFQKNLVDQQNQAKKEQAKRDAINTEEKRKQQYILYTISIVLFFVVVLVIFIFRGYRQKQKANHELAVKNQTIAQQKHLVEEKQREVIESITYAKHLQEAILPSATFINEHLPKNFVLYKPKDIVAGDFYWAEKIDHLFFVAAADSTGHGVPGAMVSVVCSNALNRSVKEFNLVETGKILDKTRELVLETFARSSSEVKDGMDISLLCIDLQNKNVTWSGANNPLWYVHNNELKEITPDKQPIGKTESPRPFVSHEVNYTDNTTFYLFTDGYADQFGGPKGKKLKYKTMEEKILAIHQLPMSEQKLIMDQMIEEWMGDLEQNDDICLIGVRI